MPPVNPSQAIRQWLQRLFFISVFLLFVSSYAQAATVTWTGNTSTAWNLPANWSTSTVPVLVDDVIIPIAPVRLPTMTGLISISVKSLTIESNAVLTLTGLRMLTVVSLTVQPGAVLTLDQCPVTITGALVNQGTIVLDGSETVTAASMTDSGITKYVGMSDSQVNVNMANRFVIGGVAKTTFNEIFIQEEVPAVLPDTFRVGSNMTVTQKLTLVAGELLVDTAKTLVTTNDLWLQGGTLTATLGNIDAKSIVFSGGTLLAPLATSFTVSGDFAHTGGIFTPGTGTVTFDGAMQSVSGNTTFYGLRKVMPSAVACGLIFASGSVQTVTRALTLTGFSTTNLLALTSSSPGSSVFMTLKAGASQSITNVNVTDNHAQTGDGIELFARGNSNNGGNNLHWNFLPTTMKWDGSNGIGWNDPFNWDRGMVPQALDSAIVRTRDEDNANAVIVNQPQLGSNITISNLTIKETEAYLDLNGFNLTMATLSNNGQIKVKGPENISIQQVDTDSGMFYYYGDNTVNTYTITTGTRPSVFFDLVIEDANAAKAFFKIDKDVVVNGSFSMIKGRFNASSNALDIQGAFLSDSGTTFTAPGPGKSFTVAGDFTASSGTFVHNNGTVTLDASSTTSATDQQVSGDNTFYDLVKQIPAGRFQRHALSFEAGSTITVTHALILSGTSANPLVLESSKTNPLVNPALRVWSIALNTNGLQQIKYVDVTDSTAAGLTLLAEASVDHSPTVFNNANWFFGSASLTWTGRVSTDWGVASNWNLGFVPRSGDDVRIPSLANQPHLTATSGAVAPRDLFIEAGSALSLDGHALTVSRTFSNAGNINLRGNETVLITTPDIDSGSFTYTGNITGDLSLAPFDVTHLGIIYHDLFIVDTGVYSFSLPVDMDMMVYGDISVSGGSLTFGNGNMDVAGRVSLTGGTLVAPGSGHTFTVAGDWTRTVGVFTPNGGRVTFDGTSPAVITGNTSFYDLSFDAPLGKTVQFAAGSNQTIANDLVMTGGLANRLFLRSLTMGNKWTLTNTNKTPVVMNVDVRDSIAATHSIIALNSVDQVPGASTNTNWIFQDLLFLTPVADSGSPRTTGTKPVLIGRGMPDAVVIVRDQASQVVATTVCNADGNFRVVLGNADAPATAVDLSALPVGIHTLTPYNGTFIGVPSTFNVVGDPATTNVPIMTSPFDGERVSGTRPVITGMAPPGAEVDVVVNHAGGNLALTLSPHDYAAYGMADPVSGLFSLPLTVDLPRGINYVSVMANGVSSNLQIMILNNIYGFVFDSVTGKPVKGASVTLYKDIGGGNYAKADTVNADLDPTDINPAQTDENGFYYFLGAVGVLKVSVEANGYTHPTKKTDSELPAGYTVVTGSRGEDFTSGIILQHIDIPLDAGEGLFRVIKDANKAEVSVGGVVTYTITIENLSESNTFDTLRLEDIIPPGFKFMKGRVLLDGAPMMDPSGNRPLVFDLGAFHARQKKTIRYQLVVGSGVAQGAYENTAYARYPQGEVISNRAVETVKVVIDPLFDAATVFGKVFYDHNENGRQDVPDYIYEDREEVIEGPVSNVEIVMEDGTVVTTDKNGQFHIPGLLAGRHLLRVNERTLPAGSFLTTDKVQVIDVTPGSSVKVNFGISVDTTLITGADARFFNTKVNVRRDEGTPKPRLNVDAFSSTLLIYNDIVVEKIEFRIFTNYTPFISSWELDIIDRDTKKLVKSFNGNAFNINDPIFWDGRANGGRYISSRRKYAYLLKANGADKRFDETKEKVLSVQILSETEWTARGRGKTVLEQKEEADALLKKYRDWISVERSQDTLAKQTIFVRGETVWIDPLAVDLKEVRVLKGGALFIDLPVVKEEGITARALLEGVPQKEAPIEMILPEGDYEIEVVSADPGTTVAVGDFLGQAASLSDQPLVSGSRYRKQLKVGEDYMMFVALGDGKIGYNMNKGNIEPIKSDDKYRPGFYQEGKMAYYLKGKIKGKYLVASSFDTERKQKEMFRGLKDDEYYPVYGDTSSVNYDAANTQGPLYLLVEWDKSQAIWGNYAVDFNDTEFARYTRTLYGGKFDHTSVATTPYGDPKTKLVVFHAEVRQRAAHNELLGTGGSLYYLKHQDIIAGTDRIYLETRDAVTGQVKSITQMAQGVDYNIDYSQGRILFWKPVSMSVESASIISDGLLNGDPVYVVSDYEYTVKDKIVEGTQGARVAGAITDKLVLGATYVAETQADKNYTLKGQDVLFRVSKDATMRAEYAESTSSDSGNFISTDGGITFSEVGGANNIMGKAYGLRYDARLYNRLGFSSYYKWVDPGFSAAGASSGEGKELKGINMTFDLTPVTRLTASYDIQKLIDQGNLTTRMQVGARETRTIALQIVHEARRLRLTGEFRNQLVTDKDSLYDSPANDAKNTAALQADYMLNEKTDLMLRHQQDMEKGRLAHTDAVGIKRRLTDKLTGTLEQSVGSDGVGTKAGLSANVTPKLALTTDYAVAALKSGKTLSTATVGAKGEVNDKTSLQTTYGMTQTDDGGTRAVIALGGTTEVDNTALKAAVETGANKDGTLKEGVVLGATRTMKNGKSSSTSVRVDDTAEGQVSTVTMSEGGRFDNGLNFEAERSLGAGTTTAERLERYKVMREKEGRKTETSYARRYAEDASERSASNIFGLSGDINDKWAANASLEQGKVQNPDGSKSDRLALATAVGYVEKDLETGKEVFKSSTKLEGRTDRGGKAANQFLVYQSLEGRFNDETTLSAKVEASETKNLETDKAEAKYKEIVLGIAYRPVADDRLNLFGRYTYKDNKKPVGQENTAGIEQNKMHVFSGDVAYDINDQWQMVERLALRIMEEKVEGFDFAKTHTWLMINRVNYRINQDWKMGGEYRILAQKEAKDQKRGFLIEAVRSVNDNVEMGVGYNFTDFMDDLTNLDYTVQGPYIRLTGKLYDRTPEERARARAKWRERRVEKYAWKMVHNEFRKKDSPLVLELNQMYQMGMIASELSRYEEAHMIYKDIILVTQMMYEEAAQFVRKHMAFEEGLYNASERAQEYYEKGEYWTAKKLWEKILEEAERAVLE